MLSPSQCEDAIRTLIETYVGDFFLDSQRLTALVEKLPESAGPVASIFSRSTTWANVQRAYQVWCLLVRQIHVKDRKHVADWVHAGVIGISRPQKGASLRREAAALLLSVAAMILSDTPDEVARCVVAARAALAVVRQEAGDDDPLGRAAQVLRSSIAQISDLAEATKYVSRVFSALGHEDREKVLRALYE
jgi:hypothetical protein